MLRKQLQVDPDPAEVRRARDWTREQLAHGGGPDGPGVPADTVVLLVSELVTNAVVHTGRPALLRLLLPASAGPGAVASHLASHPAAPSAAALRVEVLDDSGLAPLRRTTRRHDTSGRGLELVELLADRWGWQREEQGKRIWCELDLPGCERGHESCKVPAGY
jgi:anti-sigma regulatory factor (Ser/Thr protein kinase)